MNPRVPGRWFHGPLVRTMGSEFSNPISYICRVPTSHKIPSSYSIFVTYYKFFNNKVSWTAKSGPHKRLILGFSRHCTRFCVDNVRKDYPCESIMPFTSTFVIQAMQCTYNSSKTGDEMRHPFADNLYPSSSHSLGPRRKKLQ